MARCRLLSRCPENVIPKRRADAVSDVIILEMMAKMILLQPKPRATFHGEMVRRVMEHVIADITENQTGKHSRRQAPKSQKKQTIKKKRERDADDGWHNKPPSVVGIIMMHAVDHIVQSFAPTSFGLVMEYVPVDEVFDQCPE